MESFAERLAQWAIDFIPTEDELALARAALIDTAGVALAARSHPIREVASMLSDAGRWATMGHVLDFDDLHVETTSHISVVSVPTVLACGGDDRAYLAAAGAMARVGAALGWTHYRSGWHATCTAGALGAACGAGIAIGLNVEELANAIALAVPAAGGVQSSFGTASKSLQVGFAAEAGVRAANLAAAGATANPGAVDQWISLVGGAIGNDGMDGPVIPGGLAVKLFPCCYALQRPIAAIREALGGYTGAIEVGDVAAIRVETLEGTLQPLIHRQVNTGLEGKFSLEYSLVASILDDYPSLWSFSDEAVNRSGVSELIDRIQVSTLPGGDFLLAGEIAIEVEMRDGAICSARMSLPPGAPGRPATYEELSAKLQSCGADVPGLLKDAEWSGVAELLKAELPGSSRMSSSFALGMR